MGDSITENLRIGFVLIMICAIVILVWNAANSSLQSGQEKLEKVVSEIKDEETVELTDKAILIDSTEIKDEPVSITVNEADTVINAGTYNDNSIINEAEQVSYVLPLTVVAICAFIAVMYYMKNKFKIQHDENTLEILKSPKITYKSLEVEELKKKYGEVEPDDKYREINSGMEPF